jgi:hypothetical protein
MSNPFAHLDSRTCALVQVVEAKLALDQQANAPQPAAAPDPVRGQPTRPSFPDDSSVPERGPKLEQFAHINGEVLQQYRHMTAADRIIKAGQLAREGGRVPQPQGDAKAIIEAAQKARGRTDDDLQLPEKGTLARSILDAGAKYVNPVR